MAKKPTAKRILTKSEKPAYTLLLKFDGKEVKQLEKAQSFTAEKTATKAIIKCLFLADHYLKEYQEQKSRADALESELSNNKWAIKNFTSSLKALHEVIEAKPVANEKKSKGKQLRVDSCPMCHEALDNNGECENMDCERYGE